MNVLIITLGCKVNQYESQAMLKTLEKNNFKKVEDEKDADVIIVNSCTVTATSDHKVRQSINKARRVSPNAVIVLTGCMAQAFPDRSSELENVDIVIGNANRANLVPHILTFMSNHQRIIDIEKHEKGEKFEKMSVSDFHEKTRAFVKIQDGCNRFCSYCIIPFARGRVRSKPLDDLKIELEEIANAGYKEVVFVGIDLSAYGQDLGLELWDAVDCACEINGIERVRLGSLEPNGMTKDVLKRLATQPKFCPQFHMSLQSGCDKTLDMMNRQYTSDEYYSIVENINQLFENPSITTDIMVGFAGETQEDFDISLEFAKKVKFSKVHVFPYSRREGTRADKFDDQLTKAVKEERSRKMIEEMEKTRLEFMQNQVGQKVEVLFENKHNQNTYDGFTPNYTPVVVHSETDLCGKLALVEIVSANDKHCNAKLI